MVVVADGLGVLGHQLCDVGHVAVGKGGVPGVVEDAHVLALALLARFGSIGQHTVKAVGADPVNRIVGDEILCSGGGRLTDLSLPYGTADQADACLGGMQIMIRLICSSEDMSKKTFKSA